MWLTLNPDDLARSLTAAEHRAISTVQLPEGMSWVELVTECLADVTALVRGHCSRYTLGSAGTLPSELRSAAVDILRWRSLSRLPLGSSLMTDARRQQYEDGMALLRLVAEGKLAVEPPPSDSPPAPPVQQSSSAGASWVPGARR